MSAYADVGFCVKASLLGSLPQTVKDWFEEEAADFHKDGAVLYTVRDTQWSPHLFVQHAALTEWLKTVSDYDFLLLISWHDYPTSNINDLGYWLDNPFALKKRVRVELEFTE